MADSLKRNIVSLAILQVGTYLAPLLTLPWLTRVLGIEGFGRLGFATAIVSYFILLTEWGYSLGASRDVAIAKGDLQKRSAIFWDVIVVRALLSLFGMGVLALLMLFVEKLSDNSGLLWVLWLGVVASVVSPLFYLQGIEKMSKMANVNLSVKLVAVPLVFLLVQGVADIYIAALIQSLSLLLAALLNLYTLFKSSELLWVPPSLGRMVMSLKKTTALFVSNAAISLYTNSSTVILGFVASETAVGAFVAAYALIKAALGLMGPVSQALFPRISYLLVHERERAEQLLRRVFALQSLFGLVVSVGVWVVGPFVVPLLLGEAYVQALPVLWVLGALPLLIAISNVFGIQIMVPLGHNSAFSAVLIAAGLVNVVLVFPLGAWWGANGAAAAMVVAEILVTGVMALFVKKNERSIWSQLWARKMSYE